MVGVAASCDVSVVSKLVMMRSLPISDLRAGPNPKGEDGKQGGGGDRGRIEAQEGFKTMRGFHLEMR